MAQRRLKCSKCDRRFSMPAHLARHANAMHGGKRRPKAAAKTAVRLRGRPAGRATTAAARGRRPMRRVGAVPSMGFEGSTRLLVEMESYHGDLLLQRTSLDGQIDAVARAMEAMGSTTPARAPRKAISAGRTSVGRGRVAAKLESGKGPRRGSLRDYITRVLRQNKKGLSPREIGTRVIKAGFKSKAKDITKAVSNTLPKVKSIKKVGFGVYRFAGS